MTMTFTLKISTCELRIVVNASIYGQLQGRFFLGFRNCAIDDQDIYFENLYLWTGTGHERQRYMGFFLSFRNGTYDDQDLHLEKFYL